MMNSKFLSTLLIFLALFNCGETLKCFICEPNDKTGEMCVDNFETLEECNNESARLIPHLEHTGPPECVKILFTSQNRTGFVRTCLHSSEQMCRDLGSEVIRFRLFGEIHGTVNVQCNYCDTDGCNSADLPVVTLLLPVTMFVILKLLY